jgi:cytochrome b involved in lipid metabolism
VVFGRVAGASATRALLRSVLGAPTLQRTPAAGEEGGAVSITPEQVASHNKESDCWVILNGKVYDVTAFLPDHPGGKKAILAYAGKDASEEFNALHNKNVLVKYLPKEACMGAAGPSAKL